MTTLEMREVSYSPGIKRASEVFESGEFVGLVGPNGAGKSTLIRILAGIWRPDSGSASLDGVDIGLWKPRERARRIAYLPQSLPEDDVLFTVQEFVEMGRYPYRRSLGGMNRADSAAVSGAIHKLGLDSLVNTPLRRLSGGERQRVAIARCLAQQTEVLLLDEPISSLDLYYQIDILRLLQSLAKDGLLVVVAIHHLEFAAQYCSRLVLLKNGQIVGHGSPMQVLTERNMVEVFRTPVKTYVDPLQGSLRLSYGVPTDSD